MRSAGNSQRPGCWWKLITAHEHSTLALEVSMNPFIGGPGLADIVSHTGGMPETMNADYPWHLSNRPAPGAFAARDAWPLRLLPSFLRPPLKARITAWKYQRTLIAMWDNSPHLLDDIGVIFAPADQLA